MLDDCDICEGEWEEGDDLIIWIDRGGSITAYRVCKGCSELEDPE